MDYRFHESVKRFQYSDIEMIGDTESGIIIGLSAEGAELADKILLISAINVYELSTSQLELLEEMDNSGFFNETPSNSSCFAAYFHVTSKCNLNCVGCYSYEDNRNMVDDLSLADVKTVLKKLRKVGVEHLIISGGEPLIRDDLSDILCFAKHQCKFAKISLISNGTVPKERYENVVRFVDEISISIEGYDETSSFIRNGSFDVIMGTIRHLSSINAPVNMIVTLHKKNLSHIADYIRLSQDLQVPFTFSILTIPEGAECNGCELVESDFRQIGKTLEEVPLPLLDVPFSNSLSCKSSCGLGRTVISVASDAKIYPCHLLQNDAYNMGNALEDDISWCIATSAAWNVEQIAECSDCDVKYLCGGGCYARRAFYSNCISSSHDPCCVVYKAGIIATLNKLTQTD